MKKIIKSLIAAAVAVCCIAPLAACDVNSDMLTTAPNAGISSGVAESVKRHAEVAYYELERPDDVRITFETDKIQKVSFKYRVLESKEYTFRNDELIIDKSVFANESAGDKRVRIFVDNVYTEVTVRVVSKVVYTVEDFNSIRENLNGVFVLGADIDFGGQEFWPIGKPFDPTDKDASVGTFEGIFDGMGHSIQNLVINSYNYMPGSGSGEYTGRAPSYAPAADNYNAGVGIFMSTGGSAQIINTSFINIKVVGRWLIGTVVGSNGGLIKNCYITTALANYGDYANRAGGIVGINGSGDAAGRIENCLCLYEQLYHTWYAGEESSSAQIRGIADYNNGIIKNSYAATKYSGVNHIGYDAELGKVPDDFDYDDSLTEKDWRETGMGWLYDIPALPGALDWDTVNGTHVFYKAGDIINSDIVRKEYFLDPDNFPVEDGWDRDIWTFTYGAFPTLKIQSR